MKNVQIYFLIPSPSVPPSFFRSLYLFLPLSLSLSLPRKEADDIADWFAAYNARNFLSWWQLPADLNPVGQSDRKRLQAALWSYLSTFADGTDSDKKDIELPLKMRLPIFFSFFLLSFFEIWKISSEKSKKVSLLVSWFTFLIVRWY